MQQKAWRLMNILTLGLLSAVEEYVGRRASVFLQWLLILAIISQLLTWLFRFATWYGREVWT